MKFLNLYFVWILLISTSGAQNGISVDDKVMQALGDHGDRIANLEKLVKTLSASHVTLQQEVTSLKLANSQLMQQIKNITTSCLNYLKCSSTDHSVTTTMSPFYSTQPTAIQFTISPRNTTEQTTVMLIKDATSNTTSKPAQTTTETKSTLSPSATSTHGFPIFTTPSFSKLNSEATTTTVGGQSSYRDCDEALRAGGETNGTFTIKAGTSGADISVLCELGGWLIIQRRLDGTVDFNRNWQDYRDGFGDFNGEFWLGNEKIYALTSTGIYTLRIEMYEWGSKHAYAQYENFEVGSEWKNYRLSVGSYHGTAGDSFHYPMSTLLQHNLMHFSTPDRDHDHSFMNCASKLESGWWFNSCYSSNLNGKYMSHPYGHRMLGESFGEPTLQGTGIEWYPYKKRQYSMRKVEMKIKLTNSRTALIGR